MGNPNPTYFLYLGILYLLHDVGGVEVGFELMLRCVDENIINIFSFFFSFIVRSESVVVDGVIGEHRIHLYRLPPFCC
jgi:hypothetical protein